MGRVTKNTIKGGVFFNAVIQGRDVVVNLPHVVTPALSGLPPRSSSFTGREHEISVALRHMDPENPNHSPVIVVSGMAGVGKTELALQAAERARSRGWFPGGILFINLRGYDASTHTDPHIALEGLLRSLGLPPERVPSETQDRTRVYNSILYEYANNGRSLLIIVDNAADANHASAFMPADRRVGAIVTSRNMCSTLDAHIMELNALSSQESTEFLFKTLSRKRGRNKSRIKEDIDSAKTLADMCGNLPLAIHILGSLVSEDMDRPLSDVVAELAQERTRLDELGYEDLTVRAAFDMSYRKLNEFQSKVFRLVALNPGHEINTQFATIVVDSNFRKTREALKQLARVHLLEKGSGHDRWRFHDLVRLYARQMEDVGSEEWRAARNRLFTHYMRAAIEAREWLHASSDEDSLPGFTDRSHAIAWLDAEYQNLVAIVESAGSKYPKSVSHLARTLSEFLELRDRHAEKVPILRKALDYIDLIEDDSTARRKGILGALADALTAAFMFKDAVSCYGELVEIYRKEHNRHAEGICRMRISFAYLKWDDLPSAFAAVEGAIDIFQSENDRKGEAEALGILATAHLHAGHISEALSGYRRKMEIHRAFGDQRGEADARSGLVAAVSARSSYSSSDLILIQKILKPALDSFRALNDKEAEARIHNNLGIAARKLGDFNASILWFHIAGRMFADSGARSEEAAVLLNLADTYREQGDREQEVVARMDAAAILRRAGDFEKESLALGEVGVALLILGRTQEALDPLTRALEWAARASDIKYKAVLLHNLGNALREVGRLQESEAAIEEAHSLFGGCVLDDPNVSSIGQPMRE